jgi:Uncharacterized protein conserved in bacteria (DUF2255)
MSCRSCRPPSRHTSKTGDNLSPPRRRRPLRPLCLWAPRRVVSRCQRHEARIRAGGIEKDVMLLEADPNLNDEIDAAYRAKQCAGRVVP